jgi:outer membrane protein assembly factor BamB
MFHHERDLMSRSQLPLLAGAFFLFALSVAAVDWPQWRGPDRNGVSKETGLLKQWPKDGPKLVWAQSDLGNGYSTPSIAGGRIYLISNRGNQEFAMALEEKDGKQVWSTAIGGVGKNLGPQYPGARSTPTVDGEALYCLGSDGDLVCLTRADGSTHWHKNLKTDFGGQPGNWAYAESPLIDGDALICTPGGPESTLVALNKKTGEIIWRSKIPEAKQAAYASPILVTVDGSKEYVQFLQKALVGVDAKTGRPLWRYEKTAGVSPANIPTPLFHDGLVFSSTGMSGGGAVKLTPAKDGVAAEEVYFSKKDLANNLGGVVEVGGFLYGTNGSALFCAEFATGKVRWQDPSVGKGSICYADGNLYVRGEANGEVALVVASPEAYTEKGRFKQPEKTDKPAWPYPVVANGRLYLRDQNLLWCYDVKDPGSK